MELLLWIATGALAVAVAVLAVKIGLMRKAARELAAGLAERLAQDTNTLLDISSRDGAMRRLAAAMNEQLAILRAQRRRYQTGDQELKQAVTNISHDLRTPLTAICGYLELLQREEKSEAAARYLRLIEDRAEAMKHLTQELFRYSLVLSAQQELTLETVCVNDALEQSLAEFYGALTQRGITPQIALSQTRVERQLSRQALERVFGNVLANAVKYSAGDLVVTLQDDGQIVFSNTARNLSEVQLGRLFDRFYTVEAARSSTGLGLSIARTLVEQMHGSMDAALSNGRLEIRIRFAETK